MTKHTQGPWFVDATRQEGLAIRADSKMVCQILGYGVGTRVDDARLIAAAPELLAQLEIARNRINDMLMGDDGQAWKEARKALVDIDATIAKATGASNG